MDVARFLISLLAGRREHGQRATFEVRTNEVGDGDGDAELDSAGVSEFDASAARRFANFPSMRRPARRAITATTYDTDRYDLFTYLRLGAVDKNFSNDRRMPQKVWARRATDASYACTTKAHESRRFYNPRMRSCRSCRGSRRAMRRAGKLARCEMRDRRSSHNHLPTSYSKTIYRSSKNILL